MKRQGVVSHVPDDTSGHATKSLGKGGGGMRSNPGVVSTTPFKRPNVSRSDVMNNGYTLPIKSGLKVKTMQTKSQLKSGTGHPPGGYRKQGKGPVK